MTQLRAKTLIRTDRIPLIRTAVEAVGMVAEFEPHNDDAILTLRPGSFAPIVAWYWPMAGHERSLFTVPIGMDVTLVDLLYLGTGLCDYSGQLLPNDRFIVLYNAETRMYVQVASRFLAEYLTSQGRGEALNTILNYIEKYEWLVEVVNKSAIYPKDSPHRLFRTSDVLQTAVAVIELRGFVSRGKAKQTGELATAAIVEDYWVGVDGDFVASELYREIEDFESTYPVEGPAQQDITTWAKSLYAAPDATPPVTDYLHNLATVVTTQKFIDRRHIGLICSAPSAYADAQKGLAAKAAKPAIDPGKHFGTVGERVEANVVVDRIENRGENEYGISLLVHMHVEPTGERLKWWTGEGLKLDEGKMYHVRLTPRGHTEWDGRRETRVSHVAEYTPPPPKEKKGKKT